MSESTDTELMTEVRAGHALALGTLFERHHAKLYRFCLRMTGNRQASEDLVQDVFMRVLKHKQSFQPGTAFSPWMFRIARNACIDHLRRSSHAPDLIEEPDTHTADQPDVDDQVQFGESVGLLRRALMQLPVDRREVLLLSRYEFKTYEEIARSLDSTVSAVKVRAHRAVKQLRQIYQQLAREATP